MGSKGYFNPRLKRFNELRRNAIRGSQVQLRIGFNERPPVRRDGRDKEILMLHPRRRAS